MGTTNLSRVPDAAVRGRAGALRSPALLAWLRLARVFQKVDQASSEHLRRWGLSVAQFDVLAHVGAAEGISQQELADALLVTKGNVCQLLNRMEHDDLIARIAEGRSNRLYLTERGRALFESTAPCQEAMIANLFSGLDSDEQHRLHDTLRKLDRMLP